MYFALIIILNLTSNDNALLLFLGMLVQNIINEHKSQALCQCPSHMCLVMLHVQGPSYECWSWPAADSWTKLSKVEQSWAKLNWLARAILAKLYLSVLKNLWGGRLNYLARALMEKLRGGKNVDFILWDNGATIHRYIALCFHFYEIWVIVGHSCLM